MGTIGRFWWKYKDFVENVTRGTENERYEISYWRDMLFSRFITYLLPVCLVALVPGVFMGIKDGYLFIAGFDLFVAISIAVISLNKKVNLIFKKVFVIFILYSLAVMLLICLGLLGPGIIYLLALSVMVALFFPDRYAYWCIAVNLLISIICALVINFKLFNSPLVSEYNLGVWIAISSNLIFLSWICVVLISKTIKSLEETITKEFKLKNKLQKEAVQRIQHNEQLKESEGHYKSLFFQNPSPMWVLDGQSHFLQVNEAAVQTYGYSNDEFLSMSLMDIKLEKDTGEYVRFLKSRPLGTIKNIVTRHRRKNREEFDVEIRVNSISFKGKEARLVIIRDMTEQIKFIKEIEGQNTKLREIAYIQSHVVRAPLARIMGLVDLIIQKPNETPDPTVLLYLDQSVKEFDKIIREITLNTIPAADL
jgi:PAS domain S-box-containing protein